MRNITGAKGVINAISLKPEVNVSDVESKVIAALKRSADVDARSIWVTTAHEAVRLQGHVHSLHERQVAEAAALAAPCVSKVHNEITITP